ncbi:MAG: hypothetical protein ACFCVG_01660 [Kineosporiaceae bacterium]
MVHPSILAARVLDVWAHGPTGHPGRDVLTLDVLSVARTDGATVAEVRLGDRPGIRGRPGGPEGPDTGGTLR